MKKPMKKTMGKRTKRFGTGGETTNPDENAAGSQVKFSKAQESWLEGADRTDPFILARMRKAVPDEVKTQVSPAKAEPAAEPAKPAKMEPEFVTFGPESVGESKVREAPTKVASTNKKPAAKVEPKEETKAEPKVESKAEADDKPVPVKGAKETKTAPKKYTSPGAFDATDEERAENRSKLLGGIKEFGSKLFSRPEKVDRSGSRGQKGFEDIKAKQRASASMKAEGSYKAGGKVKSASARADGCAIRGKTRA